MLTKLYRATRKLLQINLKRIPFMFKVCTIFFVVSILGLLSDELIGSGHHLVEDLVESQGVWYLLLIYLVVRACILLFSNNVGITGGLFVPTLAFGAIAGSLVGTALTSLGLLPPEYYSVTVIIGIASVLASFSRTPVMAIAFSLEALGAVNNVLPVILGVTAAFVLVERYESLPFTDVVIEARTEDANKGKEAVFMEAEFTVAEGAFIVDKEIRDILWPSGCIVTSVHKSKKIDHKHGGIIDVGDKLHFHFKSYDLDNTLNLIKSYVGEQPSESDVTSLNNDADDDVPEF
jgi:CIC family chloride channel protein